MSSSMRNFMEAYSAVHSTEAKEEFYSQRDPVSEMNTASLTDNDLREIAEEVCEELFAKGFEIQEAADVLSDVLAEGENAGRNAKLSRIFDAFAEAFDRIQSKANELEAFAQYRNSKRLQETWSSRFNQDKRIQRHHSALVAEDVAKVKAGILQMVEGLKPYPAEKVARKREQVKHKEDIHVRRGEYDKADKQYKRGVALAMKTKMKKEEVEQIEEKKKSGDPCWVGYKQVGMKKKGGKQVPNCVPANEEVVLEKKGSKPDYLDFDGDGDEKESMKKALSDKKKKGLKKEGVQFSEAELKAFEEIVNSWED